MLTKCEGKEKSMKAKSILTIAVAGLFATVMVPAASANCGACGSHAKTAKAEKAEVKEMTIVETAVAAGSFSTLVAAVEAAGLAETLSGPGPFTVFAPTDSAFAKLPKGTVEKLLKDPEKLAAILTYHVVTGKVTAGDVAGMKSAKTVQGQDLRFDTSSGVKVNQARVITPDIMASNGVIHVIDEVLLPN
jgi:uncharacterized surface protein with fasciclin (FAS1) repeats